MILLRAGDVLSPGAEGGSAGAMLGGGGGRLRHPGRTDAAHAWAWLAGLARAGVALAERRRDLPAFAEIPFPGRTLASAERAALRGGAAGRRFRLRPFPRRLMRPAAPVLPPARGLLETRHLSEHPHALDGGAFRAVLPDFRATAPEAGFGLLPAGLRPGQSSARSTQTSRWSEETSGRPVPTRA